jgi:hypothetical protein
LTVLRGSVVPKSRRSPVRAVIEIRRFLNSMKPRRNRNPNCKISIRNKEEHAVNQRDKRLAIIIVGIILVIPLAIGLLNIIVAFVVDTFQ